MAEILQAELIDEEESFHAEDRDPLNPGHEAAGVSRVR
jgi:hypothetical protein